MTGLMEVTSSQSQKNTNHRAKRLFTSGLIMSFVALSGCVVSTLDIASRGEIAIPSKLQSSMRDRRMNAADPVLIRIFKQESELEVWKRNESGHYALLKTYPMCRWSGRLGPKKKEGDRQAPEGIYEVTPARLNPKSQFLLSFDLGYPNKLEAAKGYTGTALMVHGACSSSGCFAISDEYVAEVYALVRDALRAGQSSVQVQSLPFRMTPENLAKHKNDPSYDFWLDLKEATTRFEMLRQPPQFQFCEGRYRFGTAINDAKVTDPLGVCPIFEPLPEVVAAKLTADLAKVGQLEYAAPRYALGYADGGMHPSFRKLLRSIGATKLAKKTSIDAVPVSRPHAALADPYGED